MIVFPKGNEHENLINSLKVVTLKKPYDTVLKKNHKFNPFLWLSF